MAESPQFQQPPLHQNGADAAAHEEINAEIRNNRPRGANPNNNTNNNANNNGGNQQPVSISFMLYLGHTSILFYSF